MSQRSKDADFESTLWSLNCILEHCLAGGEICLLDILFVYLLFLNLTSLALPQLNTFRGRFDYIVAFNRSVNIVTFKRPNKIYSLKTTNMTQTTIITIVFILFVLAGLKKQDFKEVE